MDMYPPRIFGRMIGRSVSTLQRWDREGVLVARRSPTNRRYYTHDDYLTVIGQKPKEPRTVAYVRVISAAQKPDLVNQRAAVEQFCLASGRAVAEYLEDVGSGLNYKRKNFLRLMERWSTARHQRS
jgi:predicted site-specific integrase-resolvase